MHTSLISKIFSVQSENQFNDLVIEIFRYQAENNEVYKKYLLYLNIKPPKIKSIHEIPFLPIDFFKSHKIVIGSEETEKIFYSSGTTSQQRSKHYITNISVYEKSFISSFERFYGKISEYCFLALLPTYLENENSSLIYMVDTLIQKSNCPESGFYLNNIDELAEKLKHLDKSTKTTILIGVSYALMDFAEKYPMRLSNTIVMETGGMKGKRDELTKNELHKFLSSRLGVETIHSEYGMTELLSQAYSKRNGKFFCPPWMKILIRDMYDPFYYLKAGKTGGINIIDLANLNSCSFIETRDLGKQNTDGSFKILGRYDHSDLRGCNLLVSD